MIPSLDLMEGKSVRQNDTYSCGAAAGNWVGLYKKVGPKTLPEWKKLLGTTQAKSTDPQRIIAAFKDLGCKVVAKQNMSVADLYTCWEDDAPVICPIQEYGVPSKQASYKYGHYVVYIGSRKEYIFVEDSSIENVLEGEDADEDQAR
jgi:predicted double-glycine peptidase